MNGEIRSSGLQPLPAEPRRGSRQAKKRAKLKRAGPEFARALAELQATRRSLGLPPLNPDHVRMADLGLHNYAPKPWDDRS
jgi:hypothetical protein